MRALGARQARECRELDLPVAVSTGGWLYGTRPVSMTELAGFPLTLVPLWLLPVLVTSHLYLIEKHLERDRATANGGSRVGG